MCPTEDFCRSFPVAGRARIENPLERACYHCGAISRSPLLYWHDNLVHTMTKCAHPDLVSLRERFRVEVQRLALEPAAVSLAAGLNVVAPDFSDDYALFCTMQLCIGAGPQPIYQLPSTDPAQQTTTRGAATRLALKQRNSPQLIPSRATANNTSLWVRALCDDWAEIVRNVRRHDPVHLSPGLRLATLAANHVTAVFSTRRRLLRHNIEFDRRTRDPSNPTCAPAAGQLFPVSTGSQLLNLRFADLWSEVSRWPTPIAENAVLLGLAALESDAPAVVSNPVAPAPLTLIRAGVGSRKGGDGGGREWQPDADACCASVSAPGTAGLQ